MNRAVPWWTSEEQAVIDASRALKVCADSLATGGFLSSSEYLRREGLYLNAVEAVIDAVAALDN